MYFEQRVAELWNKLWYTEVQSSLSTVGSKEERGSCAWGNSADSSASTDAVGALTPEVLKAQSSVLQLASVFWVILEEIK